MRPNVLRTAKRVSLLLARRSVNAFVRAVKAAELVFSASHQLQEAPLVLILLSLWTVKVLANVDEGGQSAR